MTDDIFDVASAEIHCIWRYQRSAAIGRKMTGFVSTTQIQNLTEEDWSVVEDVIEILSTAGDRRRMRDLISSSVGNAYRISR